MKRGKRIAGLTALCVAGALAATARTLDVTAYGAKPDGADIFRSSFQLADHEGNSGEQILHTNYRHMWDDGKLIGDRGDARDFRGCYDPWNPIWLAGHFLCAAADLRKMGVAEFAASATGLRERNGTE